MTTPEDYEDNFSFEDYQKHTDEVEIAHFERTGKISTYAILGKTWAEIGFPEP